MSFLLIYLSKKMFVSFRASRNTKVQMAFELDILIYSDISLSDLVVFKLGVSIQASKVTNALISSPVGR